MAVVALVGALVLMGCGGKKAAKPVAEIVEDTVEIADASIYGICGDGTSMHSLQLLVGGDTLVIALNNDDQIADVQGGLAVGDSMAVVCDTLETGTTEVRKVVNVTSLMARWASLGHQFSLLPDGRVEGSVREPHAYSQWKLLNGRLVLAPDTFDITLLGPDSLYIECGGERLGYRRMK